ncbi:hypothetical protein ACFY5D_16410 [Paeniglutamicibacter sp. NPDC012692]|uniref:hypothetical protein n=1 Tax=Paeniglutamicibacter sp. NPDC012692 TaxID=3364388 RepID=UPI0036955B0F
MDWPTSIPSGYNEAGGQCETDGLGESIASTYWQRAWTEDFLGAFEGNERNRQETVLAMFEN